MFIFCVYMSICIFIRFIQEKEGRLLIVTIAFCLRVHSNST